MIHITCSIWNPKNYIIHPSKLFWVIKFETNLKHYENPDEASQSKFTSSCNVNTNSSSKCCLSKCQCEKDDAGQIILAQVNFAFSDMLGQIIKNPSYILVKFSNRVLRICWLTTGFATRNLRHESSSCL